MALYQPMVDFGVCLYSHFFFSMIMINLILEIQLQTDIAIQGGYSKKMKL